MWTRGPFITVDHGPVCGNGHFKCLVDPQTVLVYKKIIHVFFFTVLAFGIAIFISNTNDISINTSPQGVHIPSDVFGGH